ncbi:MAG: hypothetical protein CM15mP4_1480 [Candidatus Neomarinimicrobiota bacterium]|nr:MAG: hypothetical protein CM15mP4_1480 [Candidatus Neomarinimicrobiota bacterium]
MYNPVFKSDVLNSKRLAFFTKLRVDLGALLGKIGITLPQETLSQASQ